MFLKRIFIWCGRSQADYANDTLGLLTDTYFSLAPGTPLTVTFNTIPYFSSHQVEQLYSICVKNGYEYSFSQWTAQMVGGQMVGGQMGSVICIDCAADFGTTDPSLAPGVQGNFQLSINSNWMNANPTQTIVNPVMYYTVVYEGTFTINNGVCTEQINPLTRENVLAATPIGRAKITSGRSAYGGDFFEGLSNIIKGLQNSKLISNVASLIPHPVSQGIGQAARVLGFSGYPPEESAPALRGRIRGAGLVDHFGRQRQMSYSEPPTDQQDDYDEYDQ